MEPKKSALNADPSVHLKILAAIGIEEFERDRAFPRIAVLRGLSVDPVAPEQFMHWKRERHTWERAQIVANGGCVFAAEKISPIFPDHIRVQPVVRSSGPPVRWKAARDDALIILRNDVLQEQVSVRVHI